MLAFNVYQHLFPKIEACLYVFLKSCPQSCGNVDNSCGFLHILPSNSSFA